MLVVSVELLHGTIRAGSADDLAVMGGDEHGDWPPSPARLFAAFVAADGTRSQCRVTDGSELAIIEQAAPPRIHAIRRQPDGVLESHVRDRFVASNQTAAGTAQEYPGRKATLVRAGVRLSVKDPRAVYVWENVQPSAQDVAALRRRAARIPYLGCSDSPARVSVDTVFELSSAPQDVWIQHANGDTGIPVPFPGLTETLDTLFDRWSDGVPARRSWYRVEMANYHSPGSVSVDAPASPWGQTLWLRFDQAVPGRLALRVSEALKAAVLDVHTRELGVSYADVPSVLHGHRSDSLPGYQLAQWLVLPHAGPRHADGRLHGAAVMLPAATDPSVIENVRAALWGLRTLRLPGGRMIGVRPHTGERTPWAAHPKRWSNRSRRWVSALPVVHERRRRGGPAVEDVALWCAHAGFPSPVAARTCASPMVDGALSLTPTEVFRDRAGARRPYSHLEVTFSEPVAGPMVLGRARQFGLGLMLPADDKS